jgi:Flp pilus assembly protein TadD
VAPYPNTLALALYRAGKWEESLRVCQEIVDGPTDDASDWLLFSMALWRNGKRGEARKWFAKAEQVLIESPLDSEWVDELRDEAEELLGTSEE